MLYIRTDMNEAIATGHIMRCLSIADAVKMQGEDTTFILSDGQASGFVNNKGYQTVVLNTQWQDMESELPKLIGLIKKENIKKILIDSYLVTERYLKFVSFYVKSIYIDDLNAFVYPVDGIICYANYWKKHDYYSRYKKHQLFLGPQYVPLRKVFWNCEEKYIKKKVESVLLMTGGTDPYGMLNLILGKMNKRKYKNINVICGRFDLKYEKLKNDFRECKNVHIYQSVSDMNCYMKEADLAVSAGGTTLYELCACGTPAISYSFADNQLANVNQFQEDGIIDYAGDARYDDVVSNILFYLYQYSEDQRLRFQKSRSMQRLVDGNGAIRIACMLNTI